jgi:pimeloyl-ACP methyl ester carboxylesterase
LTLPRPLLALALLLTALLVACSSDDNPAPDPTTTPAPIETATPAPAPSPLPPPPAPNALNWQTCRQAFQCAFLNVPLDYREPSGRQIDVALMRLPATQPSRKIGSLLVNPGGPGGSAIDFMALWNISLPDELRARFDLVAFDPRGVGVSTPLVCHDGLQAYIALDPTPDSEAEWSSVEAGVRRFVDECARVGRDILPHMGTENVVRDMDQLRRALGEEQLSYIGYSYGTAIGAVYADLFPDRVRAFVLDGAMDLSLSGEELALQQARGFELALEHFLADCKSKRCINAYPDEPEAAIQEVLRRADQAPIPAPSRDRPAGPGEALTGILQAMYTDFLWPSLARALNSALAGDGSGLVSLTDMYLQRRGDGSYGNLIESNLAVNCLDDVYAKDVSRYRALAQPWSQEAPHFGAAIAQGLMTCAVWPAEPVPLRTPQARGAPPIVVIGTTGDPATPYGWAVKMSQQLESAILLTSEAEGHTAYLRGRSCIDNAVNAYLLNLTPPPRDLVCK